MARKLRVEYGGACYHVINRGNYRRELFSAEGAAQSFIGCLMEAAERFAWRLHGYVVMSNHFHLAVETPEPNLSEGMKWLQGTWARRFNEFRQERGRPFQGRYKALHVEPGHALAQVVHYLHLNPVRAKLVTADTILQYRSSSLVQFTKKKRPDVLEATTVLWESGGLSDTPAGWKRYVEYLGLLAEEDVQRRQERYGRLSRGWAIGSEEFRTDLSRRYEAVVGGGGALTLTGADRTGHLEVRALRWEDTLQALSKSMKLSLDELGSQRSAPKKVKLAAAMKQTTSVSNGWLAQRLGMGLPASVSQYVRRFQLKGLGKATDFQRALSRVKS